MIQVQIESIRDGKSFSIVANGPGSITYHNNGLVEIRDTRGAIYTLPYDQFQIYISDPKELARSKVQMTLQAMPEVVKDPVTGNETVQATLSTGDTLLIEAGPQLEGLVKVLSHQHLYFQHQADPKKAKLALVPPTKTKMRAEDLYGHSPERQG